MKNMPLCYWLVHRYSGSPMFQTGATRFLTKLQFMQGHYSMLHTIISIEKVSCNGQNYFHIFEILG